MTSPHRWAAAAATVGAVMVGLPAAGYADTPAPVSAPIPPGVTGITACTVLPSNWLTGIPPSSSAGTDPASGTPSTVDPTSTAEPTPPADSTPPAGQGSTGLPTDTPGGTAAESCVDASGNIFIFYTITTTTTITTIDAPILTANGPVTWISGQPAAPTTVPSAATAAAAVPAAAPAVAPAASQAAASTRSSAPATAGKGWVSCRVKNRSARAWVVTCPAGTARTAASQSGDSGLFCRMPRPSSLSNTGAKRTSESRTGGREQTHNGREALGRLGARLQVKVVAPGAILCRSA